LFDYIKIKNNSRISDDEIATKHSALLHPLYRKYFLMEDLNETVRKRLVNTKRVSKKKLREAFFARSAILFLFKVWEDFAACCSLTHELDCKLVEHHVERFWRTIIGNKHFTFVVVNNHERCRELLPLHLLLSKQALNGFESNSSRANFSMREMAKAKTRM
jgi:hypothetical protein